MPDIHFSVVVVAEPSANQSALRAMVDSIPVLQVVGAASGCLSALRMAEVLRPDFVLVDAGIPENEVITFLQSVRETMPATRVIVLRIIPESESPLLEQGATALLSRDCDVMELLGAFFTHVE